MSIDPITSSDTPDEGFQKINDNFVDLDTAINNLETDVASLEGDGVGGVTDHGLLSGLGDDDHTQYSKADGTRVKIPRSSTAPSSSNVNLYIDTSVSPHTLKSWTGSAWEAISYEGAGVGSSGVVEDFEDSTLGYTFTGPWTRSDDFAHTGSWSFKSPVTAEGATSEVTANIVIPADSVDASVSFWYRVDSESGSDHFRFLVDSTQELEDSGFVNWTFFTLPLTEGSYTLKFRYVKDSSGTASGDDAAWIDDLAVSFTVPGAFGGGGSGSGGSGNVMFDPVRLISYDPVTPVSGLITVDGVTVEDGDRVILANQTVYWDNGIYVAASGTWSRATDADAAEDFVDGKLVYVTDGTLGGASLVECGINADPFTLDDDSIFFEEALHGGTATRFGVVQAASQSQVDAGTESELYMVTPATLAAYSGITNKLLTTDYQARDHKDSVKVATTANITLSGTQTIDGISVVAGNRVLVKNQSTGSQNGIYVCASGAWSRATDADTSAKVTPQLITRVEQGTVNANKEFYLSNTGTITLGTTALTFAEVSGGSSAASETVAGVAEIATQTETDTGTDDVRIVTPLKAATRFLAKAGGTLTGFLTLHADPTSALHAVTKQYADGLTIGGAPPASETTAGIAEIATQTETNTGTDDTRIVTPSKLANYTGLGSGGFTPDYVAQSGSSALFSAWGDGNPVRALDKANGSVSAGPTPTQLGTTVARCVRFRLPVNLSVSHVYLHGNAVTTGIYTLAIYPVGTGSSRLWNPGAINTTSQSVVDLTADTPFSLTANTNYWMCISANTTGTTAGVSSPEAPILGLYGADAAPFGNTSIGIPVLAQFAVTAGAMPSTLPAVAAMGSWTRSVPIFLFAGTPS